MSGLNIADKNVVHIENLTVYYGQTPAIAGVCLDLNEGDYLGIIGPNGGGKSTLLKAILGLVPKASGTIQIYGKAFREKKGLIGYVPQFSGLNRGFPITTREVVLTGKLKQGLSPFHKFSIADKEATDELLERVGIYPLAGRQISALSGGEFQKMLIARALAVNPKCLLLDEPTASVDASSRDQIYGLLAELNRQVTIILVTHDLLAISSQVRRLACLNGRLIYHGEPELSESILNSLYGCSVDLIAHGVTHRLMKEHKEGSQLDQRIV